MKLFAVLLLLLATAPAATRAASPVAADTSRFTADSAASGLRVTATLQTQIGNATSYDSVAVDGRIDVVVTDEGGERLVRLTGLTLNLADSVQLSFDFGAYGTIESRSGPGDLLVALPAPGPAVPLTGEAFIQTENEAALQGEAYQEGTGVLATLFPPGPRTYDLRGAATFEGSLTREGDLYRLTFPVAFEGATDLNSRTRLTVRLEGHVVSTGQITTSREETGLPERFALAPAYPNPFNPRTTITLHVDRRQDARVAVYDLLGREVARLHEGALTPGRHRFDFDAHHLPSGSYLIRADGLFASDVRRIVLAK